jgi:hypothetical protein
LTPRRCKSLTGSRPLRDRNVNIAAAYFQSEML